MDPCSIVYSLGVGLLLFAVMYLVRRLYNWFERRNAERDVKEGKDVKPALPWGLDHTDRSLIRVAIGASLVTMLLCWFQGRKRPAKSYTVESYTTFGPAESQEAVVYSGQGGIFNNDSALNSAESNSSLGVNDFQSALSSVESNGARNFVERNIVTPPAPGNFARQGYVPPPPPNGFVGKYKVNAPQQQTVPLLTP